MSEIEHFFLCLRCIFLSLFASSPLFKSLTDDVLGSHLNHFGFGIRRMYITRARILSSVVLSTRVGPIDKSGEWHSQLKEQPRKDAELCWSIACLGIDRACSTRLQVP